MSLAQPYQRIYQEEYTQALARFVINGLVTAVFSALQASSHIETPIFLLSLLYFVWSFVWLVIVRRFRGDYVSRRIVTLVTDVGITTLGVYWLGPYGAALYPMFIWLTVAYGMRFGPRYLLMATALGLIGFGAVISISSYWHDNRAVGTGLLLGMIVLPIFFLSFIKKLHITNASLTAEQQKNTYAATHDSVTQLANHSFFAHRMREEIAIAQRYSHKFAVLYVDVQGLRFHITDWNDELDNKVRKIIADRIHSISRKSDLLAYLGNEQFGILMHELISPRDIQSFAQKLLETLTAPLPFNNTELQIAAHLGVSLFPQHGNTPEQLIYKAHLAMSKAKFRGANNYTVYLQEVAS